MEGCALAISESYNLDRIDSWDKYCQQLRTLFTPDPYELELALYLLAPPRKRGEDLETYMHRMSWVLNDYSPIGVMQPATKLLHLRRLMEAVTPKKISWPLRYTPLHTWEELYDKVRIVQALADCEDSSLSQDAIEAEREEENGPGDIDDDDGEDSEDGDGGDGWRR